MYFWGNAIQNVWVSVNFEYFAIVFLTCERSHVIHHLSQIYFTVNCKIRSTLDRNMIMRLNGQSRRIYYWFTQENLTSCYTLCEKYLNILKTQLKDNQSILFKYIGINRFKRNERKRWGCHCEVVDSTVSGNTGVSSRPRCSIIDPAVYLCTWENNRRWPKSLDPQYPHGRPGWRSCLLVSAWSIIIWKIFPSLSAFQVNKWNSF